MKAKRSNHIMIQGPCAAESREQVVTSAEEALKRDVRILRASLWKPRTLPGSFEGVGKAGLPWFKEVAQMGLTPATEVMSAKNAESVMEAVLAHVPEGNVLVWIGSRNQNHVLQREIGKAVAGESRVFLMVKNPMWRDADHWKGAVGHILSGGVDPKQILLCHRGFAPKTREFRNPPDLDFALQVKVDLSRELNVDIPMLGDPSHAAGYDADNVISMACRMLDQKTVVDGRSVHFDGLMVEVHSNPEQAMTDNGQQITPGQLDQIYRHAQSLKRI